MRGSGAVQRVRARLAELGDEVRGAMPTKLLETIALRFDAAQPDAPAEALEEFLSEKAYLWQGVVDRLAEFEGVGRVRAAAEAALARGDFPAADARLAELEETVALEPDAMARGRRQARLRAVRADVRLLKGDTEGAARDIEAAAELLLPFAPAEAAALRHASSEGLYREACHVGGPGAALAVALLRRNEAIRTREADPDGWLKTQLCLGLALSHQGGVTDGEAGVALLDEAVAARRGTLDIFARGARPSDWAMAQLSLGFTLLARARRSDEPEPWIGEAIAAFRAARGAPAADLPEDWAEVQFEHGQTILNWAWEADGQASLLLFLEAADAFRATLAEGGPREPVAWAATQNNLGLALNEAAGLSDEAQASDLLAEADTAYSRALEVFARERRTDAWASTQYRRGRLLAGRAGRADGPELYQEAIAAFRGAMRVHTEAGDHTASACARAELGLVFEDMGDRGIAAPALSYRQALDCLEGAHAAFAAHGEEDNEATCVLNLSRVAEKLGSAES